MEDTIFALIEQPYQDSHIAYLHELYDVVLIAHLAQLHNNKK